MADERKGTFIPEAVLKAWEKLRLNGTTLNVLIAFAHQQYRYGGREAMITQPVVATRTALSLSTVKRSVKKLCDNRLLMKLGRGRWRLGGVNIMTPPSSQKDSLEGVSMVTPSRCHDREPFAILLLSIVKEEIDEGAASPFSEKQIQTLNEALSQLEGMSGSGVLDLEVPPKYGGDSAKSYVAWLREVVRTQNRVQAGLFVRAMLALIDDERVVGKELTF